MLIERLEYLRICLRTLYSENRDLHSFDFSTYLCWDISSRIFLWVMEICAKTVLHFHFAEPAVSAQFCFYFNVPCYMRINDVRICNFADRNGIIVALGKRNSNWTESSNALLGSRSSIKSLATWNSSIRRAPAIRETGQVLLVLLSSSVLLRSMDLEMPTI